MNRRLPSGTLAIVPEPVTSAPPPRTVRLAALLAALEAVALLGLAVYYVIELVAGRAEDPGVAGGALAFEVVGAAVLLGIAWGLDRVHAWSRSPSIALQILFLPVGYTLAFQSGQPWWGIPVLALAVGEIYLLMTPEARLAFERRPSES